MGILTKLMGWGSPILKVKIKLGKSTGMVEWDVSEKIKPEESDYKVKCAVSYVAKMIFNLGNIKEHLLLDRLVSTVESLEGKKLKNKKVLDSDKSTDDNFEPQSVLRAELYEKSNGALNLQTHASLENAESFAPDSVYYLIQDLFNSLPEEELQSLIKGVSGVLVYYKSNPAWGGPMDLMKATQFGFMLLSEEG